MLFNLENEEYYCKYWRQHYENILTKLGFSKTNKKENVSIGHFDFAKLIGYGFPNCMARKKAIHEIYKNEVYYPKSILINKSWAQDNKKMITNFIGKSRKVLKNDFGVGSHNVYIVKNYEDCIKKMNDKNYYVLQNEIDPLLYQNKKLDERVYILVIKEKNTYSAYTFKEGHVKLAGYNFDRNSDEMGSFATNIKAPKPSGSKGIDFTIDTENFLSFIGDKQKWKNNRLELLKKIAAKFLPYVAKNTEEYFDGYDQPLFLWHLYGIDILIDKKYNMYLCEFNGKPGVVYDDVMPKEITNINRNMCNRIMMRFIAPWITKSKNTHHEDKTITKLAEFNNRLHHHQNH